MATYKFLNNDIRQLFEALTTNFRPSRYEKYSVGAVAASLSLNLDEVSCTMTIVKNAATTNEVVARYMLDGTNPTAVNGMPLYNGSTIELAEFATMQNFKIISTDANNQEVNVMYYKETDTN